jgi:predicted ribosome quality control (RQC) complex YloA/Tae2 family protein
MLFLSFQRAMCKMPVECLPYWSYLLDFFVVGVQKVKLYEDQIKASNGYAAISYTADLLMANLHISQPGASAVQLADFETGEPVTVALDPLQTALTTAQKLYKRSQKLRRSEKAVAPLLANANEELSYLCQVEVSLQQLEEYGSPLDLKSLQEVRDELIEGGYLKVPVSGMDMILYVYFMFYCSQTTKGGAYVPI